MIGVSSLKTFAGGAELVRALPTAVLAASTVALAWRQDGSIASSDWLPYAALIALLLATVLTSSVGRLSRLPLVAAALVAGFGLWAGISATWSPLPALARDEFLLCSLYASILLLQALTLGSRGSRLIALAGLTFALAGSAVATAAALRYAAAPLDGYTTGRLTSPVTYVNAQAAISAIAFWPALVLASRRGLPAGIRAAAFGGAVAMLAVWLMTQSKGGGIALAASALVVLALTPFRLRLLPPLLMAAGLVSTQYGPLTAPFREEGEALIRHAGTTTLVLFLVALGVGVVYALGDNRITLPTRARRVAASAAAAVAATALVVSAAAAEDRIGDPGDWADRQWQAFKSTSTASDERSSHLVSLGSNRYDFWKVSLAGFTDHPLGGIGARGFGPLYLQKKESYETPARAHSLPLEVLLETGIIGAILLGGAFLLLFVGVARKRATEVGAAALGALTYFTVHASGDWIWTFPAVGLPLFAFVGIALAPDAGRRIAGRPAMLAAAVATAFALILMVPPWLSSRLTTSAVQRRTDSGQLDWARILDPISVEPLLAEATLAPDPQAALAPLEEAVRKQPRAVALRLRLGLAYLDSGRIVDAQAQLRVAQDLFPDSREIAAALRRATAASR